MYVKITCSNGFCGCDEDFYEELPDNMTESEIDSYALDILYDSYSFTEPDGRFLTHSSGFFDEDYEEYDEDYDEYRGNLCYDWEYITKEEYEDNI